MLADPAYTACAEEPEIDILKQVYGHNAVPGGNGTPGFNHNGLNLAVTDIRLGPDFRPNARLAVCVTHCDDPAPSGPTFRPEVCLRENPRICRATAIALGGSCAIAGGILSRGASQVVPAAIPEPSVHPDP